MIQAMFDGGQVDPLNLRAPTKNNLCASALVELLMGIIAPIAGCISAILIIKHYFGFSFWLCMLLGLPIGTVIGWLVMFSFIYCVYLLNLFYVKITNGKSHP